MANTMHGGRHLGPHKEACLRIYKLSPVEDVVIYFYTLTIDGKDYSSDDQFSKNHFKQRESILKHICQFTSVCNGSHTTNDKEESQDPSDSSNKILHALLHQGHPPLQTLRSVIGNEIYQGLGLGGVFDKLLDARAAGEIRSVQILTDDFEIPWEWACRDNETMLCELMNVGKLYPKHIETYDEKERDRTTLNAIRDLGDLQRQKASFRVLLVYDDMKKCSGKTRSLEHVEEEIRILKDCFLKSGFEASQIRQINGQEDGECLDVALKQELHSNTPIKVIHLSGHIDKDGNLLHQDGKLSPDELMRLPQARARLHESKPFIFLNGCSSGTARNIYRESFQLSTVFACLGASACLTTIGPIVDKYASRFSRVFYDILLNEPGTSIGEVLRKTRTKFAEEYGDDRPEPYYYCIIGKPDYELFPFFSSRLAMEVQAPTEDEETAESIGESFGT